MANKKQLDRLLKQGVKAWNAWREKNPSVVIDLTDADLEGADLLSADLREANLRNALQLHFFPQT